MKESIRRRSRIMRAGPLSDHALGQKYGSPDKSEDEECSYHGNDNATKFVVSRVNLRRPDERDYKEHQIHNDMCFGQPTTGMKILHYFIHVHRQWCQDAIDSDPSDELAC